MRNINCYKNVSFRTIISATLRLLDARVLDQKLHIVGIKMLRKIVEVENRDRIDPCSDWSSEDLANIKQRLQQKQKKLQIAGVIEFLCKHISEETDDQIAEESVLVCIAMCIGGNKVS